jgi:hypothetical protein
MMADMTPAPELRADLDALAARIERSERDPASFTDAVTALLTYVARVTDLEALDDLEASGHLAERRARFGPAVLRFVSEAERAVRRTGRGEHEWGAAPAMRCSAQVLDLAEARRIVVIGSGPVPDSLFVLRELTESSDGPTSDVELIGLDLDSHAVDDGRALVAELELDRISILHADAAHYDYSDADVVCCSIFATPRPAVYEQIGRTAPAHCQVLIRDPVAGGVIVFERLVDRLPPSLVLVRTAPCPAGRFSLAYHRLALRSGGSG